MDRITAFLFHAGGHTDPQRLEENAAKSFQGAIVLGMGFTFDDTDTKGAASSLASMYRLIEKDPRNEKRIFPFLGGEELNNSPTHAHHRYVINFEEYPLKREKMDENWADMSDQRRRECLRGGIVPIDYADSVAADWPDLLAIVNERVRPERLKQADAGGTGNWWRFLRPRPELERIKGSLQRILAISQVTQHVAFAFIPADIVASHRFYLVTDDRQQTFCVLQSTVHDLWSRFFGSSLEERFMYAAVDCFETFPFPLDQRQCSRLDKAGGAYYDFRARLMVRNNEGLTKTYNRFHNPEDMSPDVIELRRLHNEMDRAVFDAYGWRELHPVLAFFPEFDDEDADDDAGRPKRPQQKKYRYRWPDEFHDEVLARLLALNAERAAFQGPPDGAQHAIKKPSSTKRGKVVTSSEREPALFE